MEEAEEAKTVKIERGPSREERMAHEVTHLPYRSWCEACVKGRGVERAHARTGAEERGVHPEICVDFCFLNDQPGEESLPVLVVRERWTGMTFSHPLHDRQMSNEYMAQLMLDDIEMMGLKRSPSSRTRSR